ncbi:MAG: DUF4286 family protein [Phycisphaerales bacterium]|jgi:hypothetical protein
MSELFSYTVAAEFDDPAVAREWVDWLRDEHLDEVLAAGALDAKVVVLDAPGGSSTKPGCLCEVHYHFPSREAFAIYEKHHAPGLRAKGIARFPVERGVRLVRRMGVVAARSAHAD